MLLLGLGEKAFHVFIAGLVLLLVAVEGRKIDHAETVLPAVHCPCLVGDLRLLLLHVDLVAHDGDVEAVRVFRLPQDRQGYLRAFLAADHLDNVAQVHVDDVNGLFPFLGHGDDLVLRLQQARALGASPGNQLFNDGKAVVAAEDGPDPLQGKLHLNPEVFKVFGGQVARVRIQGQGEGLGEARNELFRIALDHPHRLQLVAVNLLLLGLRQVNACQQGVFDLELHDLSQELTAFPPPSSHRGVCSRWCSAPPSRRVGSPAPESF